LVIVEAAARMVGADRAYIERELARQLEETERRRVAYRIGEPVPLKGRTVIVVNDGIATGGTVRAALKALAHAGPARIVLAVARSPARYAAGAAQPVRRCPVPVFTRALLCRGRTLPRFHADRR
jgi:predicted phosphoribosyltransferase